MGTSWKDAVPRCSNPSYGSLKWICTNDNESENCTVMVRDENDSM